MKNVFLIGIMAIIFFYGCKSHDTPYFNGDVTMVGMPEKTDYLKGEEVVLDGVYAGNVGDISVYDSLIIFKSTQFAGHLISIFSLNTKKHIGSFCNRGNGPGEMDDVDVCDFMVENGHLKQWLFAFNKQQMLLFNITQSLDSHITQYDSIFTLDWKKKYIHSFNFIFTLDNNEVLAKCPANPVFYNRQEHYVSNYYLFNPFTGDTTGSYILHHRPLINELNKGVYQPIYLASVDQIKPDKSKVAMGMFTLSQINILDLKTGKLRGFRNKNTPDEHYLEKKDPVDFVEYYRQICVDNDFIYVLYLNDVMMNRFKEQDFSTDEVHVFDWDGHFLKKVILDHPCDDITMDPVSKKIYAYNVNDEKLYVYDMNKMKK